MNQPRACRAALVAILLVTAGVALSAAQGPVPDGQARLTILYDNTTAREGVQGDWGFACLIEGMGRTILFDTGTRAKTLLDNVRAMGVDLGKVEAVVISHLHGDHTGGLVSVLKLNPAVTVYVPAAISDLPKPAGIPTLDTISGLAKAVVQVSDSIEICPGARLTGQIVGGNRIAEVGLLLETKAGGTLITGCAHPGIVDIVRRAAALRGKPVEAVIGGFHLMQTSQPDVRGIIADMKAAGVVRCGATHCTGDPAIAQFREAFGAGYIPMGVGRVIEF